LVIIEEKTSGSVRDVVAMVYLVGIDDKIDFYCLVRYARIIENKWRGWTLYRLIC